MDRVTVQEAARRLGISQDAVRDASRNELITELRDRVRFLEAELTDRKEESRRKDHIIAALTQRIPQLEPVSEPREHSENPTENLDRGTTGTNESSRLRGPLWVSLLGDLVSVPRLLRKQIRSVERSE